MDVDHHVGNAGRCEFESIEPNVFGFLEHDSHRLHWVTPRASLVGRRFVVRLFV
jgi:hypothetical protein